MTLQRRRASLLLAAALPLLLATKCFDPLEPDAGVTVDGVATPDAGGGGIDGDAGPSPPDAAAFVPATPCAMPGEARLLIADYAYEIRCGCREASGKVCSIPSGTLVIWQFADAEEHNVASEANAFGSSGERLTGSFSHVFDAPGVFPYGCTIHLEMGGYSIVVD